ncbi:MAG TPA: cytochrome c [Bacteroidia bacterium]|jgi:cytochrome c2|nr:cytochrome c [Bacteroidia bacterium]
MKTTHLILLASLVSFPFTQSFAGDGGGDMFKANCGACHTVGNGKLVGPDLKGVETRHTESWMLKWIKSSQAMVQAGDKEAVKLFADNSSIPMPDQALTDDQIKTILGFIKAGGQDNVVAAVADPSIAPDNNATANQKAAGEEKNSASFFTMFSFTEYLLMSLLGFLLLIIYILGTAIRTLAEKHKEQPAQ